MNDTTTSTLIESAQINEQKAFAITKYDQDRFLSALAVDLFNFKNFFESQPVVFTALGLYMQHTKDEGALKAINDFMNAVRGVNSFAISIAEKRGIYMDLEEFISSIPLVEVTE